MKNAVKKVTSEEILRIATLESNPEPALINSVFQSLLSTTPAGDKRQETLERLKKSLSAEDTFGELVSRHMLRKQVNTAAAAQATSLPEQTIQALTKDTVLPFSVPVVLVKRFIEYLGIPLSTALRSLAMTTALLADAMFEEQDFTVRAGVSARRGYEISLLGIEPRTLRDRTSVLQSGERYLVRLKQLAEKG
jgi:hypothetical protein